jgi:hypothetical protein
MRSRLTKAEATMHSSPFLLIRALKWLADAILGPVVKRRGRRLQLQPVSGMRR